MCAERRLYAILISFLLPAAIGWAKTPANAPYVQRITPKYGMTFGGTQVSIAGNYFTGLQQVTFGGIPGTITYTKYNFIKVNTPEHAVGPVDIAVQTNNGTTVVKNAYTYTIGISPATLSDGIPAIQYQQTLSATGGVAPYQWSVTAGSLPPGLTLDPAAGVISGLPLVNYAAFPFTATVTDSSSPPLQSSLGLSITIDIGLKPIPVPATFFGMSAIAAKDWPTITIGAFGKASVTNWPFLEPAKGQFNWSWMDAFVNAAKAHGVTLYWTNHGVPKWAAANQNTCTLPPGQKVYTCTSTVQNISDWDDFVTALVARYKGKVFLYELWNEPDTARFTGTLADMVELTSHFYNAIRAGDPQALIASPSFVVTGINLDSYFAAGGPTGVDLISIHGYPTDTQNNPEGILTAKSLSWKATMVKWGLGNLPMMDLEGSWGPNVAPWADPQAQVAFLARYYLLHWSAGVTAFYWYSWDDPAWGTLWSLANGVTPAGNAYDLVMNWMTGAIMPEPCAANGTVYTCSLTRANGYQALAVWDVSQTCSGSGCTTSSYTPDLAYTQYRDLAGGLTPIQPGQVIQIGARPILLENQSNRMR